MDALQQQTIDRVIDILTGTDFEAVRSKVRTEDGEETEIDMAVVQVRGQPVSLRETRERLERLERLTWQELQRAGGLPLSVKVIPSSSAHIVQHDRHAFGQHLQIRPAGSVPNDCRGSWVSAEPKKCRAGKVAA